MTFHENHLLADDSHVISLTLFLSKIGKTLQNVSSAAVVIGALRVKSFGSRSDLLLLNCIKAISRSRRQKLSLAKKPIVSFTCVFVFVALYFSGSFIL